MCVRGSSFYVQYMPTMIFAVWTICWVFANIEYNTFNSDKGWTARISSWVHSLGEVFFLFFSFFSVFFWLMFFRFVIRMCASQDMGFFQRRWKCPRKCNARFKIPYRHILTTPPRVLDRPWGNRVQQALWARSAFVLAVRTFFGP